MNSMPLPRDNQLWLYTILAPLVLNSGGLLIYGGYYSLKYMQPGVVANLSETFVSLAIL